MSGRLMHVNADAYQAFDDGFGQAQSGASNAPPTGCDAPVDEGHGLRGPEAAVQVGPSDGQVGFPLSLNRHPWPFRRCSPAVAYRSHSRDHGRWDKGQSGSVVVNSCCSCLVECDFAYCSFCALRLTACVSQRGRTSDWIIRVWPPKTIEHYSFFLFQHFHIFRMISSSEQPGCLVNCWRYTALGSLMWKGKALRSTVSHATGQGND